MKVLVWRLERKLRSLWRFINDFVLLGKNNVIPQDNWRKMGESENIPETQDLEFTPGHQPHINIYEADIVNELKQIDLTINEALEFYFSGDVNSEHKFSWEKTEEVKEWTE